MQFPPVYDDPYLFRVTRTAACPSTEADWHYRGIDYLRRAKRFFFRSSVLCPSFRLRSRYGAWATLITDGVGRVELPVCHAVLAPCRDILYTDSRSVSIFRRLPPPIGFTGATEGVVPFIYRQHLYVRKPRPVGLSQAVRWLRRVSSC